MHDLDRVKQDITSRLDIVEVVSEHVALKQRGSRWLGLCPFHSEKTPSFNVSPEKGFFKCFGCGRGGDIFTFVQLREGVDFGEALRMLADRAGVELRRPSGSASNEPGRVDLAKVNVWAAKFFRDALNAGGAGSATADYVRSRGFSEEIQEQFGLGYAQGGLDEFLDAARSAGFDPKVLIAADLLRTGERDSLYCTFRNRLMFPIRDVMTRVVGFGGRTMCDDQAKYLNTRQNALFDKGRGIYGIDRARQRISELDRAIVVEGYTDCIAAHQAGFSETVATLGTALTDSQVDLLRRYASTAILLFDADKAGEAAAERAIRVALPRHLIVRLAQLPEGTDPADFLQTQHSDSFAELLNSAVDALEFKWRRTVLRFDKQGDGRQRKEAITEFMTVVAEAFQSRSVDEIDRGMIVTRIAGLVSIDAAQVHRILQEIDRSRVGRSSRGDQSATPAVPTKAPGSWDAEQAGLTTMLEVLLNEPGHYDACQAEFVPERFSDTRDRAIATRVASLAQTLGEFQLSEVLNGFEEPAIQERVVQLAEHGSKLGNYENTLLMGLDKVRNANEVRPDVTIIDPLGEKSFDGEGVTDPVSARIEASRKRKPHFAPPRMRGSNLRSSQGQ